MKIRYCKICGLELEDNFCDNRHDTLIKFGNKICDSCGKKIDEDSIYCSYCGMPQTVNGHIKKLQDELKGTNAIDVIEYYEKENKDRKHGKNRTASIITTFLTIILVIVIVFISFSSIIIPLIKKEISDYQLKKMLENAETFEEIPETTYRDVPITTEESTQPTIELKGKWVKSDGYYYAYDESGDLVVDDWVTETDEDGEEKKYYFDEDGRLVVNSWIDAEYYVGADGVMLKNQSTPDGAFVDEDGRVVLQSINEDSIERETYVYYENSNSKDEVSATTVKSNSSGEIRGVDANKQYELYVKNIKQYNDTVVKGNLSCNITYFMPIIAGVSDREVNKINQAMVDCFENKFAGQLRNMALSYTELPRSITLNTVQQRNVTSNKMNILLQGRIIPRSGLNEKKKFRFVYDRKSGQLVMTDISD